MAKIERNKVYQVRQVIFDLSDRSQILVDLWYVDGVLDSTSLALRAQVGDVWGVPVEGRWV